MEIKSIEHAQDAVEDFRRAFDQPINKKPTYTTRDCINLDISLMDEELSELKVAMLTYNMIEIADGIADLLYVVLGTAVSYGINIEPIFNEVHRSNMTKVGGHKNEMGKHIKPNTYSPPNLLPILIEQGYEPL